MRYQPLYFIQAKDKTEMTALHCAALEGSVKVAKLLIDQGACLRCFDEEGMTPLHFAAMEGSLDVAQYIFEVGENCLLRSLPVTNYPPITF